jgi:hypothetical protein
MRTSPLTDTALFRRAPILNSDKVIGIDKSGNQTSAVPGLHMYDKRVLTAGATGATRAPDAQFGREARRSENIESFKTPLSEEL